MPACPHLVIQESERELVSRGLEMEAFRSRVDDLEGELRDERGMHQREVRRIEEGLLREIALLRTEVWDGCRHSTAQHYRISLPLSPCSMPHLYD